MLTFELIIVWPWKNRKISEKQTDLSKPLACPKESWIWHCVLMVAFIILAVLVIFELDPP